MTATGVGQDIWKKSKTEIPHDMPGLQCILYNYDNFLLCLACSDIAHDR